MMQLPYWELVPVEKDYEKKAMTPAKLMEFFGPSWAAVYSKLMKHSLKRFTVRHAQLFGKLDLRQVLFHFKKAKTVEIQPLDVDQLEIKGKDYVDDAAYTVNKHSKNKHGLLIKLRAFDMVA